MMLPRRLLVAVMLAAGCSTPADSGAVTVSSLQSLEAGRTKAAAGDFDFGEFGHVKGMWTDSGSTPERG